jgi:hypothetical protein
VSATAAILPPAMEIDWLAKSAQNSRERSASP